jgi:hypothetical protein
VDRQPCTPVPKKLDQVAAGISNSGASEMVPTG